MEPDPSLLIMTEDSPNSFSPAGERVRYMALAGSLFFEKVWVLTLGGLESNVNKDSNSKVLLQELRWSRGLPYPIYTFFDPVKALLFFFAGLILTIQKKPSHVVASMPPVEAGVSAWLLAKLTHKKLIVDLRDDIESYMEANLIRYIPIKLIRPLFKLTKRVYSSAETIFAATETIANITQERKVNTLIRYVPNGADTSLFQPQNEEARNKTRKEYSLPSQRIIFVYIGSGINLYYRLDTVLHAVKALPEATKEKVFFLFYIYDGIVSLSKLKEELKLTNDLTEIREPLLRSSLAKVLAACDVGLVPFDNKSYLLCARSTKLYEYLSSGTCIVCSGPKGGELETFISNYSNLGVFTEPTVEGFTQVVSKIAENAEVFLSDDMKSLRHQFVQDYFDRKKTMTEAMQTLQD